MTTQYENTSGAAYEYMHQEGCIEYYDSKLDIWKEKSLWFTLYINYREKYFKVYRDTKPTGREANPGELVERFEELRKSDFQYEKLIFPPKFKAY